MVAEAEARASAHRLRGKGVWSGRSSCVSNAEILDRLMKSDFVFNMSQDEMIPMIAFGPPLKVVISERWF
jgi:hypothetical protein